MRRGCLKKILKVLKFWKKSSCLLVQKKTCGEQVLGAREWCKSIGKCSLYRSLRDITARLWLDGSRHVQTRASCSKESWTLSWQEESGVWQTSVFSLPNIIWSVWHLCGSRRIRITHRLDVSTWDAVDVYFDYVANCLWALDKVLSGVR